MLTPPDVVSAPSGRELEIALLKLLRKNNVSRGEYLSVLVVGPRPTPIYILTVGDDLAKVLEGLLTTVLGRRPQPSSTEWILFRADADAILRAVA